MALTFLATWIEPAALGENMIKNLMLVMLMEFITIHSSAFFGVLMFREIPKMKKIIFLLLLGGFYTIFVAGFSLSSGEWWPIVAFWGLIFNRLMSVVFGNYDNGKEGAVMASMWVAGVVCYLGGVTLTIMLPIPPLGVTKEIIHSMGMSGSGLWIDEPHRLVAFGALYFSLIGLAEISIEKWGGKIDLSKFSTMKSSFPQ